MSAIPTPLPPPEDDEDDLRKYQMARSGQAIPAQPIPASNNPMEIPAIDTKSAAAVSPTFTTVPHRGALASLWADRSNIHNPAARILAKIGNTAANAIDIGAGTLAPAIASRIPGTTANAEAEDRINERKQAQEASVEKTQADAKEANARADALATPKEATPEEAAYKSLSTQVNPDTGKPYTPYEAYQKVKNTAEKTPSPEQDAYQFFIKQGMTPADAYKQVKALGEKPPAEKATAEQLRSQIVEAENKGDTATAKKLQQQLKDIDPMGQQRIVIQQQNAERQEDNATRKDIATHDKAYVQPAEQVEKSYQMMDHAYQEYKQAAAQGKELPTGAQSMLALSTHLSTTFGNVKGSRVTKDMIHEHLGARSISDDALVAIQKLTNGDQLSPAQWDAFHDLISQSRKLSWDTAVKEANRKKIPVDFLPPDLKANGDQTDEGGGHPFFSQFNGKPR